ncbi:hypothetical protein SLEP1_g11117 [Rubroshorea leprosula]|uniref:Retrotransposon gag domain-containing protein n=1 Tax=Rubroshorea leprosula TaxID=152421 RepID=A0AAV5IL25_9ROSI|nr:hypothetical protein SLEP1_g11117 [Rubroshorea leprosula]
MAFAFSTKFSSRRLIRKTTSKLMRVKQREGESLKNYMSRFNDVVLEVNSFNQAVGIAAVIQGLQHERFRDSLLKHPAATFNDRGGSEQKTDEDSAEPRFSDDLHTEIRKTELDTTLAGNRQGVGYQQASPPLPPPARIIHMITGGLEARGLSSKQRKLYVREVKHQNRTQKRKFDDADWKNQPITFTSDDFDTVVTPHNDPLVTSIMINNCEVQCVLVDTGSAPDIMYFHCFESLGLDPALLQWYDGPIYGFNNQPIQVERVLTLNVAFGSDRTYVTPSVRFLVVKMASSFNVVIGRPTLTKIQAVVSQSHLCMKFSTPMGIATLRGNQKQVMGVEIVDNRPEDEIRATPVEDVEEVHIDDRDPRRKTQIGTRLNPKERVELIPFLRANNDVFAWISANMPRIPTLVIKEEVEKLLQAGFVRRVDYCEWVANPVLVKKANATSGNGRLSLLDEYFGYHQVPMAPEDEEKTSFYASDEIYCYIRMPFGLKNASATYKKNGDYRLSSSNRQEPGSLCRQHCESGKFLGFMVSRRGIEVNLEKIRAITEMEPPKSIKDIQRLTERVATLHRFISKSADKCLPFFKIMSSPPLLTKAIDGEILYLYLGVSDEAISSVLLRE